MRKTVIVALVLLAGSVPVRADETPVEVPPAEAEPMHPLLESCVTSPTPDAAAIACTTAIESRQLQGEVLATALYARGMAQARRGQMPAAINDFTAALDVTPDATDALYARGSAHAQLQRHDLAVDDFTRLLQLAPDDADSLFRRAWSLTMLGRDQEALIDLNAVIAQAPDDMDVLMDRGGLLIRTGSFKQAVADFDKIVAAVPDNAEAHYNRGRAFALMNEFAAAAENFAVARAKREQSPYAVLREYLAVIRGGQEGQKLLLDALAQRELEQWPMPIVASLAGQISESDLLASANAADPAVAKRLVLEAHFYLGEAALAKQDAKAARAHFDAAAKGDHTVPEVIDAIWRLKEMTP